MVIAPSQRSQATCELGVARGCPVNCATRPERTFAASGPEDIITLMPIAGSEMSERWEAASYFTIIGAA
jgi:hypothetical protein